MDLAITSPENGRRRGVGPQFSLAYASGYKPQFSFAYASGYKPQFSLAYASGYKPQFSLAYATGYKSGAGRLIETSLIVTRSVSEGELRTSKEFSSRSMRSRSHSGRKSIGPSHFPAPLIDKMP